MGAEASPGGPREDPETPLTGNARRGWGPSVCEAWVLFPTSPQADAFRGCKVLSG